MTQTHRPQKSKSPTKKAKVTLATFWLSNLWGHKGFELFLMDYIKLDLTKKLNIFNYNKTHFYMSLLFPWTV